MRTTDMPSLPPGYEWRLDSWLLYKDSWGPTVVADNGTTRFQYTAVPTDWGPRTPGGLRT